MRLLLAGATGQLGTAVAELGDAMITPLVRRHRPGRLPLERTAPELAAAAVSGDVNEPFWGLAGQQLDELAGTVDAVVNLAGETNWAGRGRDLYAANVLGAVHGLDVTRELQRRAGRRIAYCYASSIFVAGGALGTVPEAPLPADRHRTEYEHSKWLAERELAVRHQPGDPDVLIVRVGALLGDSVTGRTHRRNSLYLLAQRWDELPGRLLPVMRGARVDVLPRDMAARTLLAALAGLLRTGPLTAPVTVHLSAGEHAPTIRSLLEAARSAAPLSFGRWVRLVPASAEQILWLSGNAERFLSLQAAWRNSIIGLRYIGLDRVMERSRLAGLTGPDLPAPGTELLARLLFGLPSAPLRPAPDDFGLARFVA
jgi:nucleoside-diphosphate-sugar epimerase